jgi:hypothetical protein
MQDELGRTQMETASLLSRHEVGLSANVYEGSTVSLYIPDAIERERLQNG